MSEQGSGVTKLLPEAPGAVQQLEQVGLAVECHEHERRVGGERGERAHRRRVNPDENLVGRRHGSWHIPEFQHVR